MFISRVFVSRDVASLASAFLAYVRTLLEQNSSLWSPYPIKDIETVERFQRPFTTNLLGFRWYSYSERLQLFDWLEPKSPRGEHVHSDHDPHGDLRGDHGEWVRCIMF